MITTIPILSDDAIKEIDEYKQSLKSVLTPTGSLMSGMAAGAMPKFQFFTLGYMPKD